jgi:hypothetical protein
LIATELETLERLLAVVTTKYLDRERTPSLAVAPAEESPVPAALVEQPHRPEAQSAAAVPQMKVQQSVSPSFGIPSKIRAALGLIPRAVASSTRASVS